MSLEKDAGRVLSVGEVAQRSGVSVATLHFYETKGLIKSWRTAGNQRRFPAIVLRYIAIIKVAQMAGISLEEISASFNTIGQDSKLSVDEWTLISTRWRDSLNQRIERLTRLRDGLDGCIGCGCLSQKDCPLRNPDDILGKQGAGPQILAPSTQPKPSLGKNNLNP